MNDLISRQAAIDALADGMPELTTVDGSGQYDHDIQIAAEAFADAMNIIYDLPSAQRWIPDGCYNCTHNPRNGGDGECTCICTKEDSQQTWIPCSERLPEYENKRYWICTDTGYQCECRWTNANHFWTNLTTDWHWNIFDTPQYTKVVAWMMLPEPFLEGEVNE